MRSFRPSLILFHLLRFSFILFDPLWSSWIAPSILFPSRSASIIQRSTLPDRFDHFSHLDQYDFENEKLQKCFESNNFSHIKVLGEFDKLLSIRHYCRSPQCSQDCDHCANSSVSVQWIVSNGQYSFGSLPLSSVILPAARYLLKGLD